MPSNRVGRSFAAECFPHSRGRTRPGLFLASRFKARRLSSPAVLFSRIAARGSRELERTLINQLAAREISLSIDRFRALQPADDLREFVAAIPVNADRVPDRRRATRYPIVVDVIVVPLDETFRPISPPFVACCRNLSSGGICFYHQNRAPSDFLYLEIDSP